MGRRCPSRAASPSSAATAKSPPPKRFPAGSTSRPHRCDTGIRKRDEHLHSADFFEAEKFPDISVVVTGADAIDGDTIDLRANLTIKGTTKPLALKTKVTPVGDGAMRLTTQATVNRQDFGVDGNMMGMIGDNATISGDVVFRRAAT